MNTKKIIRHVIAMVAVASLFALGYAGGVSYSGQGYFAGYSGDTAYSQYGPNITLELHAYADATGSGGWASAEFHGPASEVYAEATAGSGGSANTQIYDDSWVGYANSWAP